MKVKTQTVAAQRVSPREDRRKLGQKKRLSTLVCLKLKSALELIPVFLFHLFIISSLHILLPSPINLESFQGRSWTQVPETLKSLHILLPSPINLGSFQGRSWTQVPETLKGWRRQN